MTQNLYLRCATQEDCKLLFDWRNEKDTRLNFFNTEVVLWQDHVEWFLRELQNPNEHIFILMDEERAIGQTRFSACNGKMTIDYSIDKPYRAQGYGKAMLILAENEIAQKYDDIILEAKVLKRNIASQCVFENIGYSMTELADCFLYTKKAEVQPFNKNTIKNMTGGGGIIRNK